MVEGWLTASCGQHPCSRSVVLASFLRFAHLGTVWRRRIIIFRCLCFNILKANESTSQTLKESQIPVTVEIPVTWRYLVLCENSFSFVCMAKDKPRIQWPSAINHGYQMTDCEVTLQLVIPNLLLVNKIHVNIGFVFKKYQIVRWPIRHVWENITHLLR